MERDIFLVISSYYYTKEKICYRNRKSRWSSKSIDITYVQLIYVAATKSQIYKIKFVIIIVVLIKFDDSTADLLMQRFSTSTNMKQIYATNHFAVASKQI